MDIDSAFNLTSKTADPVGRRAAIFAIAAASGALEGSVVAQTSDLPDTASTATRFAWGDAPPASEDMYVSGAARRVFTFTSANASYLPSLDKVEGLTAATYATSSDPCGLHDIDPVFTYTTPPQMCASEATAFMSSLESAVNTYTSAGFSVTTMDEAHLGPGVAFGAMDGTLTKMAGSPPVAAYSTFWGMQRGGALVAVQYSGSDPIQITT